MLTDVQIINDGISKLGSSRVKQIAPPVTPLEVFMAARYPQWKRSELTKRRWVFALVKEYSLTQVSTTEPGSKPFKYNIPNDCLRPIRGKRTEWEQRGRYIFSAYDTLAIDYIKDAAESEFDPLFNDVLSARVQLGSVEYITQSATKKADAKEDYKDAIKDAGRANAFVIGPEDIDEDDNELSWLEAGY